MSCCDSRDDRVLRVFPEEDSLLQNVVNRQTEPSGTVQIKERVIWTKIDRWIPCKRCVSLGRLSEISVEKQPFFLITIALENSLQLWLLYSTGACDLVCSLGGEDIRIFQHLACPKKGCRERTGPLAIKISANVGLEIASLLNLRSFDEVEKINLLKNILNVMNNENYIVFAVPEEIFVYSNDDSFSRLFSTSSCFYDANINLSPMALGAQWLAFADARLVHRYECGGGVSVDANSQLSYTSALISGAQSLAKGLISITGSITAALTRSPSNSPGVNGPLVIASPDLVGDSPISLSAGTSPSSTYLSTSGPEQNGQLLYSQHAAKHPGVVTVINCKQFALSRTRGSREAASGLVAHFPAHTGAPLAFLQFSPNGALLATADTYGREFNVFRILAHPSSVSLAAVHHLYSLHRGDTTATVVEMSFSPDSRWLVVGTHRGTAHVFPITPYGGAITRRTHCRKKVPNRFSRFHQSAGLDMFQPTVANSAKFSHQPQGMLSSPRSNSSPLSVGFPPSTSPKIAQTNLPMGAIAVNGTSPVAQSSGVGPVAYPSRLNARLPPYPHPVPVRALYQIKQALSIPGLDLVNTPIPALSSSFNGSPTVSTSLPANGGTMSSLSVAVNSLTPTGVTAAISMAFSPVAIYRPASQLISAAVSLSSLSGSGLSNSLGSTSKTTPVSPAQSTLCLVTWQGDLIEYKLSPRVAQIVSPDKLCEDSPIELECDVSARWPLVAHLQAAGAVGGVPDPLYSHADMLTVCPCAIVFGQPVPASKRAEADENCPASRSKKKKCRQVDSSSPDHWIAQVETFTCSASSRRIWSGPQFSLQPILSSRNQSEDSVSPRPSVSTSHPTMPSQTSLSLSASPNVCHSEDSAFGDQERVITPPSSESSSASGSMTVLPSVQPTPVAEPEAEPCQQARESRPVDIESSHPNKPSGKQGKNKKKNKANKANNKHLAEIDKSGVLEALAGANDACVSEGTVETDLLAAAVQDFNF